MDAVSAVDDDILANSERFRAAGLSPKKKRRLVQWSAAAASFLLIAVLGVWLSLPVGGLYVENCAYEMILDTGESVMLYERLDRISRAESAVLPLRRGALFMETPTYRYYRVKGADDLYHLIGERLDGTGRTYLFAFSTFSPNMPEKEEARRVPPVGEQWKLIFGVESASDIRRVTFEKGIAPQDTEKVVPVPTVTLTDAADVSDFYAALSPLTYSGFISPAWINSTSNEYLEGRTPLSIQTMRRVTVEFRNGRTCTLSLYPESHTMQIGNGLYYNGFSDDALAWLIDRAEIDMVYRDYGTDKNVVSIPDEIPTASGEVIAPPSVPETEKVPDVGYTD